MYSYSRDVRAAVRWHCVQLDGCCPSHGRAGPWPALEPALHPLSRVPGFSDLDGQNSPEILAAPFPLLRSGSLPRGARQLHPAPVGLRATLASLDSGFALLTLNLPCPSRGGAADFAPGFLNGAWARLGSGLRPTPSKTRLPPGLGRGPRLLA